MAGRSVGSSWGSRVPWRLAPAVAGVVSLGSMARMVLTTSRFVTNGDGAHVWYAAHEWGQGRWHEPAFYGQSYGSNALGVPIAALHALGVPYPTATPAVMTLSILLLWLPLAAAFQRRGHLAVATVTAALPALTATYYEFYVASVPYERLFGATGIGVALLIATRRSRIALGFGAALAGIGVAADTSALILVLPVGAWWVLEREHPRAEWWSVAAGGSVAAAYGVRVSRLSTACTGASSPFMRCAIAVSTMRCLLSRLCPANAADVTVMLKCPPPPDDSQRAPGIAASTALLIATFGSPTKLVG